MTNLAISGQHYLFNVQTFAQVVLNLGGSDFEYMLRDRTTQGVIDDVASGKSEIGVIIETKRTATALNAALESKGLRFTQLAISAPRIALPSSHPMVNAKLLSIDQMHDYPYLYFEQEEDAPIEFAEEALASIPRGKKIACTDRASLSELIVALNGYTVTSGILVGVTDGTLLKTVPLETDEKLYVGYISRDDEFLSDVAQKFVTQLSKNLDRYSRF